MTVKYFLLDGKKYVCKVPRANQGGPVAQLALFAL
jgi:hypothetical protein